MSRIEVAPEVADVVVRGRKRWDALGLLIAEMPQEIGWSTGYLFTGMTLAKKEGYWSLVIRAEKGERKCVAFFGGRTIADTYRQLWWALKGGRVKWKTDKYA